MYIRIIERRHLFLIHLPNLLICEAIYGREQFASHISTHSCLALSRTCAPSMVTKLLWEFLKREVEIIHREYAYRAFWHTSISTTPPCEITDCSTVFLYAPALDMNYFLFGKNANFTSLPHFVASNLL